MYKFEINNKLKPGLYCVSTPIGNMADITFRALHILKHSDIILSEDTRVSSKLLSKFDIKTKLLSNHKFNEKKNTMKILSLLKEKRVISLISDAGTPAISDPGRILINECYFNGINVFPVPGASAVTAAVSASGFSDKYYFCGFLPEKKSHLDKLFQTISKLECTLVFFISPRKIKKIENQIQKYFIDRDIFITREMTKLHEEYIRDNVKNLNNIDIIQKGEMTIVISESLISKKQLQEIDESVRKKIKKLLNKMSLKDIAFKINTEDNISKKTVYDYCLKKKNET